MFKIIKGASINKNSIKIQNYNKIFLSEWHLISNQALYVFLDEVDMKEEVDYEIKIETSDGHEGKK